MDQRTCSCSVNTDGGLFLSNSQAEGQRLESWEVAGSKQMRRRLRQPSHDSNLNSSHSHDVEGTLLLT